MSTLKGQIISIGNAKGLGNFITCNDVDNVLFAGRVHHGITEINGKTYNVSKKATSTQWQLGTEQESSGK